MPKMQRVSAVSWAMMALTALAACQPKVNTREFAEETTGGSAPALSPPPQTGQIQFASVDSAPRTQEVVPGLLSEVAFESGQDTHALATASRYHVEVRTLLVGPGKSSEVANLPGGAVFEVRSGTGSVTVGQSKQELTTGSTFAIGEGESFRLTANADSELALRVYVIRLR